MERKRKQIKGVLRKDWERRSKHIFSVIIRLVLDFPAGIIGLQLPLALSTMQSRLFCLTGFAYFFSKFLTLAYSAWKMRKCWIELWHLFSVCFLGYKLTWKQIISSQLIKAKATELPAFSQLSKILRLLQSKRVRLMLRIPLTTECYEFSG